MGALYAFDLQPFIDKYGLKHYFETGTGEGNGLLHAVKYDFISYTTVDIDLDLLNTTINSMKEALSLENFSKINFFGGPSKEVIGYWGNNWLDELYSAEPCLFFLDAHFPGADFHKLSYEESLRTHMWDAFPLKDELTLIKELRDTSKDVFIIDDFILYEDGDYDTIREGVTWNYGWLQEELGLQTNSQFIYDLFGETHNFTKDTRHQGYLIITPKD